MTDPADRILVSAATHTITIVTTNPLADSHVHTDVRYDGLVQLIGPDGAAGHSERCLHLQPGVDGAQRHPHREPAEAIECGRALAAARWPDTEISEAAPDYRAEPS
jgi:hypothetical protein